MRIPIVIFFIVVLTGCSSIPMIALSDDEWKPFSELPVKGRSGFFIRQKLSFGEFRTGSVARSWTKGGSWRAEGSFPNDWLDRIAVEWVSRKQTVRFTLTDDQGRFSQVTALARVQWRDLRLGGSPSSLPFGGSVGFEFKNREGKVLAAVSMIGNGAVYFGECSDEEKFLLANASAALLLQQLLDEGVR
jgi:hypothetical protein